MAKRKDPRKEAAVSDPWAGVLREARDSGDPDRFFATITTDAARAGNADAARDILETFADAVDRHSPQAWEAIERAPRHYVQARYLADAFRSILAGADPRKALNLTKPQGRQRGKTIIPHEELAAMFHFLVRRGVSKFKAKDEIARETGMEPVTINRAAMEWDLSNLENEDLKAMFRGHAARMGRILGRLRHKPAS